MADAIRHVTLRCWFCKQVTIELGNMDFSDMSEGERWDEVKVDAQGHGWRVDWYDPEGKRIAVCPDCIVTSNTVTTDAVKEWNPRAVCVKCRCRKIETLFVETNPYGNSQDHLKRQCTRCKFSWLESPADKLSHEQRPNNMGTVGESSSEASEGSDSEPPNNASGSSSPGDGGIEAQSFHNGKPVNERNNRAQRIREAVVR